jgi:hypothetical protein
LWGTDECRSARRWPFHASVLNLTLKFSALWQGTQRILAVGNRRDVHEADSVVEAVGRVLKVPWPGFARAA